MKQRSAIVWHARACVHVGGPTVDHPLASTRATALQRPSSSPTRSSQHSTIQDGSLPGVTIAGGAHALQQALVASGVKADGGTVDWSGYMRIEAEERRRGEAAGRPFAKFVHVADMLAVAHSTPAQ